MIRSCHTIQHIDRKITSTENHNVVPQNKTTHLQLLMILRSTYAQLRQLQRELKILEELSPEDEEAGLEAPPLAQVPGPYFLYLPLQLVQIHSHLLQSLLLFILNNLQFE